MKTLDGIQRRTKTKIQKAPVKRKIAWAGIISLLLSSFVFVLPAKVDAGHNADGLAGYWNMDDSTANPTLDSSGHGNNGAISGGAVYTSVGIPSVPGNQNALTFDGFDDFVSVAHDSELDMTGAYSISAWVNVTDVPVGTYRPIVFRGATNANDIEVYVQHTSGDLIVAHNRGNGGTFDYVGFVDPPAGLFHLVVTYGGGTVQAYYDGAAAAVVQQTTAVTAPLDTDKGWWFGKVDHAAFGGTHLFEGLLDEVRIYDRALSAEEIADLMDDADGVLGASDFCPGTESDVVSWVPGLLGTNRWELNGDFNWQQNKPKVGPTTSGGFAVADTYGCSGQQILDLVSALTGEDLGGHYKYGLSSSMLKDFIEDGKDGIIDGINSGAPVETVAVPADDADGVSSAASLALGKNYKLKASGTADACVSGCGYSIIFDPEYSTSNSGATWEDGVAAPYDGFGPDLLDLKVNGGFVNWDDDAVYNADHTYWNNFVGAGAPVNFLVSDLFYGNNTGSLAVDIFVELY